MVIGPDRFIEKRIEKLYVCGEHKLFFLTGQANGNARHAYIAVKAFHTMDGDTRGEMMKTAEPWTEEQSCVQISVDQGMLAFSDQITGTVSNVPWSELDDDVQQRLRVNITGPFQKYACNSTRTVRDIPVGKPLSLKRTPST